MAGDLVRLVRDPATKQDDVFLLPSCTSPCSLRQYGDAYRILLRREGVSGIEVWDPASSQLQHLVGLPARLRLYEGLLATDVLFTLATRLRPYERRKGQIDELRTVVFDRLSEALAEKKDIAAALESATEELWAPPHTDRPGARPVVGVTGDLYTRMNPVGNAGLFRRLEEMGV
jgi:predicted nucleotide-binding protein (sugar kinase/HSP70/actin superfamily)